MGNCSNCIIFSQNKGITLQQTIELARKVLQKEATTIKKKVLPSLWKRKKSHFLKVILKLPPLKYNGDKIQKKDIGYKVNDRVLPALSYSHYFYVLAFPFYVVKSTIPVIIGSFFFWRSWHRASQWYLILLHY